MVSRFSPCQMSLLTGSSVCDDGSIRLSEFSSLDLRPGDLFPSPAGFASSASSLSLAHLSASVLFILSLVGLELRLQLWFRFHFGSWRLFYFALPVVLLRWEVVVVVYVVVEGFVSLVLLPCFSVQKNLLGMS